MTWETDLDQQWKQLQSQGRGTLRVPLPNGEIVADLPTVHAIGCECRSLTVTSRSLAGATASQLTSVGQQLASRLTYLLEPLRVIELDDQSRVLQMRSVPPTQSGNERFYYEVLVKAGGQIEVARYATSPGQTRQRVPATFTREVFTRLVRDTLDGLP